MDIASTMFFPSPHRLNFNAKHVQSHQLPKSSSGGTITCGSVHVSRSIAEFIGDYTKFMVRRWALVAKTPSFPPPSQ
jgi:hypothetical protein